MIPKRSILSVFRVTNRSLLKHSAPKRRRPTWVIEEIKAAIRHRLATEDYTCRMVDPGPYRIKPRVRYKLSLKRHYRAGSFRGYLVYK